MPPHPLRDVQRVAAYGLLRDDAGRTVVVRASAASDLHGVWFLPGGGIDFGEHPRDAVVREVAEETGVEVRVTGLRDVVADVLDLPHRGIREHSVRCFYDLAAVRPDWEQQLRVEAEGGTTDAVRLVGADELAALPLMPYVARALGLPVPLPPTPRPPGQAHPPQDAVTVVPFAPLTVSGPAVAEFGVPEGGALDPDHPDHPDLAVVDHDELARVQRVAAYALCHDAGRVLLTRLRSTDLWTLPGGGLDHGEEPADAAVREVHEETGLPVALEGLLDVDSIRFTGHGPSGRVEDFHGVRVIYAGRVPTDVAPQVVEVDGSTEEVAWWPVDQARRLRLAGLVRVALKHLP